MLIVQRNRRDDSTVHNNNKKENCKKDNIKTLERINDASVVIPA